MQLCGIYIIIISRIIQPRVDLHHNVGKRNREIQIGQLKIIGYIIHVHVQLKDIHRII